MQQAGERNFSFSRSRNLGSTFIPVNPASARPSELEYEISIPLVDKRLIRRKLPSPRGMGKYFGRDSRRLLRSWRQSDACVRNAEFVQGSAKRWAPGSVDLVNFVTAVAYYFCLVLPVVFTQPRARLLAGRCIRRSL